MCCQKFPFHIQFLLCAVKSNVFFYVVAPAVEDPSEDYQRLRDFVDVRNCMKLDSFSPEHLNKGFSKELIKDCQQKLKINKVNF